MNRYLGHQDCRVWKAVPDVLKNLNWYQLNLICLRNCTVGWVMKHLFHDFFENSDTVVPRLHPIPRDMTVLLKAMEYV